MISIFAKVPICTLTQCTIGSVLVTVFVETTSAYFDDVFNSLVKHPNVAVGYLRQTWYSKSK